MVSRCYVPCLAHQTSNAILAGASLGEALDAAAIWVEFSGGPSYVMVRNNLSEFLDDCWV